MTPINVKFCRIALMDEIYAYTKIQIDTIEIRAGLVAPIRARALKIHKGKGGKMKDIT